MFENKKRCFEMDALRIVAMLTVIMIHICGMETKVLPVSDGRWQILTFFASSATWGVPVFVMISGRFFLDPQKNVTISSIWKKSVVRIVVAFVLWDIIYQAYYLLTGYYDGVSINGILAQSIVGPYHFWFIHMIIWIYAITPLLRCITCDKKLTEYYIFLFFLFEVLINYGVKLPGIGSTIEQILKYTNIHFVIGFSGYYVLGYYLYKYAVSPKQEAVLYVLGCAMLIFVGLVTVITSTKTGQGNSYFTDFLMPNTIIICVACYTFFVKRVSKVTVSEKVERMITKLGKANFGTYLIHALILDVFKKIGLTPIIVSPFVALPILTIMCYVISATIACGVQKLPKIGRYIT